MSQPSGPYAIAASRDESQSMARWARLGLTFGFALLARSAFHGDGYIPLLFDIDTAVHEFGHMLFMPFGIPFLGRTMVILGGSLTQFVFPLIFAGYFLRPGPRRDVHAGMVCVWWASINLLEVSIYAADARAGQLMLLNGLTGQESDAHDWANLFRTWGLLSRDTIIAARMRAVAVLMCVASVGVGLYAAWFGTATPATLELE